MSKLWTTEEDIFLKFNFDKMTDLELGKKLNRSESAIITRRSRIGLNRFDLIREMNGFKTCKRCNGEFPTSNFYNYQNSTDKLSTYCKDCDYEFVKMSRLKYKY